MHLKHKNFGRVRIWLQKKNRSFLGEKSWELHSRKELGAEKPKPQNTHRGLGSSNTQEVFEFPGKNDKIQSKN